MYCCITYLFSAQNLKLKAPEVKFPGLLIYLGFDISYSVNSLERTYLGLLYLYQLFHKLLPISFQTRHTGIPTHTTF